MSIEEYFLIRGLAFYAFFLHNISLDYVIREIMIVND